MIIAKGNLIGKIANKQALKGKINKTIEYIEPTMQEKTAIPTKQIQEILPDENFDALSKVTINPIPNEYIVPTGEITINQNGIANVSQYANANINVPIPPPNLQNKEITITENETNIIKADAGYDGLDEVEITTNISGGDITHEEYLEDVELAKSILEDFVPYIELEYIESTGEQYIDTGYYPNQDTKVDLIMESIDWGDFKNPFGVRTSSNATGSWVYTNRFALWLYANKSVYFHINLGREFFEFAREYTATKFHLIAKNGYVYIKDITNDYEAEEHTFSEEAGDFVTDFSMPLGAFRQTSGITNLCKFKLYSCKIYENDVLVRNFIPAISRVNDDVGVYDTITKTFINNAGVGNFVAGGVV